MFQCSEYDCIPPSTSPVFLQFLLSYIIALGMPSKQAEKLKSREMKEGWMKNDGGWMKDERRMMNDEGWWFQAVEGFWWRTERQTD